MKMGSISGILRGQGLVVYVLLGLAVVFYGWILVPRAVPLAPGAVVILYAALAHFGVGVLRRTDEGALRIAYLFGILGALVLVPSLLIQYAGKTVNNALMSGSVLALWFLSGCFAARQPGGVLTGTWSAAISAMISSLTNVMALLCSYYSLRGTELQATFFKAERAYEDFANSGMADFDTWAMEDLFGGAFFHLLFGALLGAALGLAGGALRVAFRRLAASRRLR